MVESSSRRPGPRRATPDDRFFAASAALIEDDGTDRHALRFAALATVPTPVADQDRFRMWIPAPALSGEKNIDEILQSLASDSQPDVWTAARPLLRDFVRIPHKGVGFVCTSEATCHQLGGVPLKVCGYDVTIKKYSLFDKWYFVDLVRLPMEVSDPEIYDYFTGLGARPVLVAPTYVARGLQSRARTVYFHEVSCPNGLFLDNADPLREIHFRTDEPPCFVNHRTAKFNRVTPPSVLAARQKQKKNDAATAPPQDEKMSDSESIGDDEDTSNSQPPPPVPPKTIILRRPDVATTPAWKLVENSKHGLLKPREAPSSSPEEIPCTLTSCASDPTALTYTFPFSANYYQALTCEYEDEATPADIFMSAYKDETPVQGTLADTPLLPDRVTKALQASRQLSFKAEHVSVQELDALITEYVQNDFRKLTNHEDILAAIQVQPAYLRGVFNLPTADLTALYEQHAVYRTVSSIPLEPEEPIDFTTRLRRKFGDLSSNIPQLLRALYPDDAVREAALHLALCDLYFMIMVPSIYVDPLRVQLLIPDTIAPARLVSSPFLLWADLIHLCMAKSDVVTLVLDDPRTPASVGASFKKLRDTSVPVTTLTSHQYVVPRL